MTWDDFTNILSDLRYLKIPKRYETSKWMPHEYWSRVSRKYGDFRKRVNCSDYHWYVITYDDGRKELAYFKVWHLVVPQGRLCRGLIPRYWPMHKFEHVKYIRLAF